MLDKNPKNRPSPAELLTHKLFGGGENKETITQTAESDSIQMNKINKSIEPKSLMGLRGLAMASPKV